MDPAREPPAPLLAGPLGFGCSALVGGRTRRESARLLAAAYDAGIRHFDLARLYGSGDAERIVGDFARPRRGEVTIATKFGLDPPRRTPLVDLAKRAARLATRRSGRLLAAARRHSGHLVSGGDYSPEKARASLQVSLRELGLEYVDAYLLHDCTAADWRSPQLRATLGELLAEGLVRGLGTATSALQTRELLASGDVGQLAQFESSTLAPGPVGELRAAGALTVTFSPLSGSLPALRERVATRPETSASWSAALGLDASRVETLADLLLADALARNRHGVVLFSSGSPERIARAASIAAEPPFEGAQLERFRGLALSLG